jgi:CHAP domain-containing protein
MTLQQKALEIAITQIGKEESPRGSNWGEPVKSYLASVGITFPASWCMSFVYWCFIKAAKELGIKTPLLKTGGVLKAWQKAPADVKVNDPQPGDIFIQDHGHGLGHTGIVEKVDADLVHTIEGNTNDTGSREGYEVCRRVRKKSGIIGYLRYV